MKDILPTIQRWFDNERPFVLARVAKTWGSAPRRVGSAMAVADDGKFAGSVSGGCVEGAVIEQAAEVLETREPMLLEFGVEDERAWSVGLSCGGQIKVLLEYFPSFSEESSEREAGAAWLAALHEGEPFVVVSGFGDAGRGHCIVFPDERFFGNSAFGPGDPVASAVAAFEAGQSELLEDRLFVHVIPGKQILLIIGGTDIATHLVRLAAPLEFETVVVDPRPVFADAARFAPEPDRIMDSWPDDALAELRITADTYAVLLSHNPKIDDPALEILLRSEARYVGALGSRKTHAKRCERLREAGFSDATIERIRGPVGLDIGASSPSEIALSIMAQIVAARNQVL